MHLGRFIPLVLSAALILALFAALGSGSQSSPSTRIAQAIQDPLTADVGDQGTLARSSLAAGEPVPPPIALQAAALSSWEGFPSFPIPDGNPSPLGTPGSFRAGFRDPLPASPVWNPPGPKRVGLQAGHWLTYDVPHELRRLSPGSSSGGWAEWELNLLLARHTARILEEAGVDVDVLPTTIPIRYRAHAFLSIHADGDTAGAFRGYKIARPGFSSIPEADDLLVHTLYEEYGAATGLPRDSDAHISRRMVFYYAFNTRRYQHAVDLGTPSAIIEAGFLTHSTDRGFLTSRPEVAARGIANGILHFLSLELGAGTP